MSIERGLFSSLFRAASRGVYQDDDAQGGLVFALEFEPLRVKHSGGYDPLTVIRASDAFDLRRTGEWVLTDDDVAVVDGKDMDGTIDSPRRTIEGAIYYERLPVLERSTPYTLYERAYWQGKELVCTEAGTTDDFGYLNIEAYLQGSLVEIGTATFGVAGNYAEKLGLRNQAAFTEECAAPFAVEVGQDSWTMTGVEDTDWSAAGPRESVIDGDTYDAFGYKSIVQNGDYISLSGADNVVVDDDWRVIWVLIEKPSGIVETVLTHSGGGSAILTLDPDDADTSIANTIVDANQFQYQAERVGVNLWLMRMGVKNEAGADRTIEARLYPFGADGSGDASIAWIHGMGISKNSTGQIPYPQITGAGATTVLRAANSYIDAANHDFTLVAVLDIEDDGGSSNVSPVMGTASSALKSWIGLRYGTQIRSKLHDTTASALLTEPDSCVIAVTSNPKTGRYQLRTRNPGETTWSLDDETLVEGAPADMSAGIIRILKDMAGVNRLRFMALWDGGRSENWLNQHFGIKTGSVSSNTRNILFNLDPCRFDSHHHLATLGLSRASAGWTKNAQAMFSRLVADEPRVIGFVDHAATWGDVCEDGNLVSPKMEIDGATIYEPMPPVAASTAYALGDGVYLDNKYLVCSNAGTTASSISMDGFAAAIGDTLYSDSAAFLVRGNYEVHLGVAVFPENTGVIDDAANPDSTSNADLGVSGGLTRDGASAGPDPFEDEIGTDYSSPAGSGVLRATNTSVVADQEYITIIAVVKSTAASGTIDLYSDGDLMNGGLIDFSDGTWSFTDGADGANQAGYCTPLGNDRYRICCWAMNDSGGDKNVRINIAPADTGEVLSVYYFNGIIDNRPMPECLPVGNTTEPKDLWTADLPYHPNNWVGGAGDMTVICCVDFVDSVAIANQQGLVSPTAVSGLDFVGEESGTTFPRFRAKPTTVSPTGYTGTSTLGFSWPDLQACPYAILAARFDKTNGKLQIGSYQVQEKLWTWTSDSSWSGDFAGGTGNPIRFFWAKGGSGLLGERDGRPRAMRFLRMYSELKTRAWIEDNFGESMHTGKSLTDPEPLSEPMTQLVFDTDTLVRTGTVIDPTKDHRITYQIKAGEDATTREQFIWCTDDTYGPGICRTRLTTANAVRGTRDQNSSAMVQTALPVGQMVFVEEVYDAALDTLTFFVNRVAKGTVTLGGSTTSSAISIGGRALLKATGISFKGVIREFKFYDEDTLAHHWRIANVSTEGATVYDLVGTDDATLELGSGTTEPWDIFADEAAGPATGVVPDIDGLTIAAADAAIVAAGLVVGSDTPTYHESVASGLIYDQDPAAGVTVNAGSSVNYSSSLGLDPTAYQMIFDGTILELPLTLDNDTEYLLEYEIKPTESGDTRAQEIWVSNDSYGGGNQARTEMGALNGLRPYRKSTSGQKINNPLELDVMHIVREHFVPGGSPFVHFVVDGSEEDHPADVLEGGVTGTLRFGGRLDQPGKTWAGVIRNVTYYELQGDEFVATEHWPINEQYTGNGPVLNSLTENHGTITTEGSRTFELREAALPPLLLPEPGGSAPEEPEPPVDPPVGEYTIFEENFSSSTVGEKYRGAPAATVINDPTGSGRGRVLKLDWSPTQTKPINKSIDTTREISTEATYSFDIWLPQEWLDDTTLTAKMSGPAQRTGNHTGCALSIDTWSCRMMIRAGKWEIYYYHEGKQAACGVHPEESKRIAGIAGWQTIKLHIDLGTQGAPGTAQFWVDDTASEVFNVQWMVGANLTLGELILAFFVNLTKPPALKPKEAMVMYVDNLLITTPEAP